MLSFKQVIAYLKIAESLLVNVIEHVCKLVSISHYEWKTREWVRYKKRWINPCYESILLV